MASPISDMDGKIIYVNEATLKMYGTNDPNDLIGKNSFELVAPEDREKAFGGMKEVMEKGSNKYKEYYVFTKSGSRILTKLSTCIIRSKAGEAIGFVGTFKDITEQKQMYEKNKVIVETALDGFTIDDLEGRVLEVNDSYCEMLGYTREELLKMSISDIEAAENPEDTARHIKKIVEQGCDHFETRHVCKDGKIIDVDVNVNYLDMGEGQLFVFVRDITEHKQMEQALWEREEKYRVVFENTGTATAIIDQDMTILLVNEECERLFGYSKEELQGKKRWTEFVVKEDLERMKEYHKLRRKDPASAPRSYEFRAIDRKGNVKDISIVTEMIPGTVKSVASLLDITDRKQIEEIQKTFKAKSRGTIMMLEERFLKYGLKGFSNLEIIELLLHHARPYKECKKLVDEINKRYKTLREFLSAPMQELEQIPGMTPHDILCFQLLLEVPKVLLKEKIINHPVPKSSKEIFDYLYYSMQDLGEEVFKVVYLDSKSKIIDIEDLFKGTLNGIHIYPREIEAGAIEHKATGLIFIHNHPSGDCTPSQNDKKITRDLVFVGQVLQIKVLDHIIIGENKYFSFADAGLISKYEDDFLDLRIRSISLKK